MPAKKKLSFYDLTFRGQLDVRMAFVECRVASFKDWPFNQGEAACTAQKVRNKNHLTLKNPCRLKINIREHAYLSF